MGLTELIRQNTVTRQRRSRKVADAEAATPADVAEGTAVAPPPEEEAPGTEAHPGEHPGEAETKAQADLNETAAFLESGAVAEEQHDFTAEEDLLKRAEVPPSPGPEPAEADGEREAGTGENTDAPQPRRTPKMPPKMAGGDGEQPPQGAPVRCASGRRTARGRQDPNRYGGHRRRRRQRLTAAGAPLYAPDARAPSGRGIQGATKKKR